MQDVVSIADLSGINAVFMFRVEASRSEKVSLMQALLWKWAVMLTFREKHLFIFRVEVSFSGV